MTNENNAVTLINTLARMAGEEGTAQAQLLHAFVAQAAADYMELITAAIVRCEEDIPSPEETAETLRTRFGLPLAELDWFNNIELLVYLLHAALFTEEEVTSILVPLRGHIRANLNMHFLCKTTGETLEHYRPTLARYGLVV